MSDTRLPLTLCPECGYALDAATSMTGQWSPSPGALTLCLSCGALLRFDDDLRPTGCTDAAEMVAALESGLRDLVEATQQRIRARGPLGRKQATA